LIAQLSSVGRSPAYSYIGILQPQAFRERPDISKVSRCQRRWGRTHGANTVYIDEDDTARAWMARAGRDVLLVLGRAELVHGPAPVEAQDTRASVHRVEEYRDAPVLADVGEGFDA
jgi:hypothetical protein